MKTHPTAERLAELFTLNAETGEMRWRRSQGRVRAGDLAGNLHAYGYRVVNVDGRQYAAHSLIWFMVHAEWPPLIDHINGRRDDNRISNLRLADCATNARNRTNWTREAKLLGVHRRGSRYAAAITADGASYHLGVYATATEAHAAYVAARTACADAERSARRAVLQRLQRDHEHQATAHARRVAA